MGERSPPTPRRGPKPFAFGPGRPPPAPLALGWAAGDRPEARGTFFSRRGGAEPRL